MRQIVKIIMRTCQIVWLVLMLVVPKSGYTQTKPLPPPSAVPDGYVVPFDFDIYTLPIPVVRLSINGHKPQLFALDTGSSAPLLVLPRYAKELNIVLTSFTFSFSFEKSSDEKNADEKGLNEKSMDGKSAGETSAANKSVMSGISTMPVRVQFYGRPATPPVTLAASTTVVRDIPFMDEFGSREPIVGIVGWPLFSKQAICLDFAAKTLTFLAKLPPATKTAKTTVLPMPVHVPNVGSLLRVAVDFGSGTVTKCIVDTGRVQSLVPMALLPRLHPLGAEQGAGGNLEGDYATVSMLLPEIKISDLKEANVVVDAAEKEEEAIFGLELLSRFRVTLDFPRQQMRLQRAGNYKERLHAPGDEIVYCKQEQGQWQVQTLKLWTTAITSGLQIGDKIISIDGTPTQGRSYLEVRNLLCGIAGTSAQLVIEREKNRQQNITYLRQQRFASDTPLGTGMGCTRETKTGRMFIKSLSLNSPAIEAGLQVNDEVVKINDRDVRASSSAELHAETKKPEGSRIILLIQRKGEKEPRTVELHVGKLQQ